MSNTKNTPESQDSQTPQSSQESRNDTDNRDTARDTGNRAAENRPSPMEVLRQARSQLTELTGMSAETVSSFEQTDDGGWSLEVEVMELARVPDTMSLMASYQVELDPQGQLTGYRRVRRYERGRSDAHRPGGR